LGKKLAWALTALGIATAPAQAADEIRLGFIVDVAGPFAALSEEMTRGFDLAIEHLGGKMGGLPVKVFKGDSKNSPDVGVTEASRFMDRDQVQFVTGILLSNVFNAMAKPLADRGVFVVSGNAGTAYYSGKECHENVFSSAFHNDVLNEAAGMYMNTKGVKSMVTVGLNYQAGKDQIGGAVRKFQGKVMAQLWPDLQAMDFASEIAQIRSLSPEAVYLFLPGRPGIAFQRQFIQAGLDKKVKIYGGAFHDDELVFDALGEFATKANLELVTFGWHHGWGIQGKQYAFQNDVTKRLVDDYVKKYNRRPTFFVAHQYDAVMLIDSAVRAVQGKVEDKNAVRAALRKADFKSTKGKFKFNNNHYPIQDHLVVTVVKDEKGTPVHKVLGFASKDHGDSYHQDCPMRW
jgi:branched-chain amino acid transport system substrate-binding protein